MLSLSHHRGDGQRRQNHHYQPHCRNAAAERQNSASGRQHRAGAVPGAGDGKARRHGGGGAFLVPAFIHAAKSRNCRGDQCDPQPSGRPRDDGGVHCRQEKHLSAPGGFYRNGAECRLPHHRRLCGRGKGRLPVVQPPAPGRAGRMAGRRWYPALYRRQRRYSAVFDERDKNTGAAQCGEYADCHRRRVGTGAAGDHSTGGGDLPRRGAPHRVCTGAGRGALV